MDYLAGQARRARPRPAPHRRRDGQLLVLRRRLRLRCSATCPNARFADATGLVNWQRAVKSPAEIGYMRKRRPHRRGDARPHRREGPPRHPQVRPRRRDPRRRHPRRRRRSAATTRPSCRCSPPAPTPPPRTSPGTTSRCARARAPSSRSPAATTATTARCRAPSSSGARPRPSSTPRAATLEGMEAGLAAARPGNTCEDIAKAFFAVLAEARHRQGQPHRLLDRPQLPARLGRAHHEPAPRRPHRAAARHDLPLHDRPLARDHGPRDHRVDPDHRHRRRMPRRRPPQAHSSSTEHDPAALADHPDDRPRRPRRQPRLPAPALQPRRQRLGLGDDPDRRRPRRPRPDGAPHRRQPRRRVRGPARALRPRPHPRPGRR